MARAIQNETPTGLALPGKIVGYLDGVSWDRIDGWAWDETSPDRPVSLRILDNGVVIGQVLADGYRENLIRHGIGDGRHSFSLNVPGGLSPQTRHVIQVQSVAGDMELRDSPWVLEAVGGSAAPVEGHDEMGAGVDPPASPPPAAETLTWRGCLDKATRDVVAGWAQDEADPDTPVALQILDNGVPIARVLANRYRADLADGGIGDGRHGFEVRFPGGLSPLSRHVIDVRREADDGALDFSPVVIEPATSFEPALEQAVENAVASLGANEEQERVLSFLAAQADRLLQLRAETEGKRESRAAYQQFRRRWGSALPGGNDTAAAEAPDVVDPGKRALVVDDEVPMLARDAGSQAVLSHMRALQQLGYTVSFVAGMDMAQAGREIDALQAEGIACCRAPFYATVEEVLRRQAGCFDVVYLHRASNASKYLAMVRQYCPNARILYSVADLHHVRLERQAEIEDRPELLALSRQLRLAECTAAWSADAVITHSTVEAALLRQAVPNANVHVVPWTIPVRPTTVPLAERHQIAFIGNYTHTPNADAVHYLAEVIMPLVWRRNPKIKCLLVGSRMPEKILRLTHPGLVPVGQVADLAEIFDRVRLTVAPLRFGAGLKGKVLVSFAAGIPCVMSPVAAEGFDLPSSLAASVKTTADEIAARIALLYANHPACREASETGLSLIRDRFNDARVVAALNAAITGNNQPSELDSDRARVAAAG
jgi:hypothetical protein